MINKEHKIKITLNKKIGDISLISLIKKGLNTELQKYGFNIKEIGVLK